ISLLPRCQHCAKHANVEIFSTQSLGQPRNWALAFTLVLREWWIDTLCSLSLERVQRGSPLDEDRLSMGESQKVPHLSLQRNICHQTVASLGVDPWAVHRVRIAIWIAIQDIKQQDQLMACARVGDPIRISFAKIGKHAGEVAQIFRTQRRNRLLD